MLSKIKLKTSATALIASMFMMSSANAATGAVGVVNRFIELFKAGGQAAVSFAFAAGLVFGVIALITIRSLGKPNQEPGKAVTCLLSIVACAGLIYYSATVKMAGETVHGASSGTASGVSSDDYGL